MNPFDKIIIGNPYHIATKTNQFNMNPFDNRVIDNPVHFARKTKPSSADDVVIVYPRRPDKRLLFTDLVFSLPKKVRTSKLSM